MTGESQFDVVFFHLAAEFVRICDDKLDFNT